MYSLSQSKGTTKLLLQSTRQDYGPNNTPTFLLNEVVQAPPSSFGLLGLEKIYWRQPSVFPSVYLNTTLTSTLLSGTAALSSLTLSAANFVQTVTMNGTTQIVNLADIYYDGSGGEFLARLLECFRMTLTTAFQTLLGSAGGTFTCDFSSSTFASWNALTTTSSTSTTLSKMDAATSLMRNNFGSFNLVLSGTTGATMAVTFTDSNPLTGLVGRVLNISSGTFTVASTSGIFGGTVYSKSKTIFINFEGLQYLKLRCSVASGAKEAHAILPGVQPTSLLALVPCTGTPGSVEYYEVASAKDRVTVRDFTMDAIQLQFVDYLERPLSALTEYAVVLSIDFMVREEETKQTFMRTY